MHQSSVHLHQLRSQRTMKWNFFYCFHSPVKFHSYLNSLPFKNKGFATKLCDGNLKIHVLRQQLMTLCTIAQVLHHLLWVMEPRSSKSIIDKNVNIDISLHTHQNITHLHLQPKLCITYKPSTKHKKSHKIYYLLIQYNFTHSHKLHNPKHSAHILHRMHIA